MPLAFHRFALCLAVLLGAAASLSLVAPSMLRATSCELAHELPREAPSGSACLDRLDVVFENAPLIRREMWTSGAGCSLEDRAVGLARARLGRSGLDDSRVPLRTRTDSFGPRGTVVAVVMPDAGTAFEVVFDGRGALLLATESGADSAWYCEAE